MEVTRSTLRQMAIDKNGELVTIDHVTVEVTTEPITEPQEQDPFVNIVEKTVEVTFMGWYRPFNWRLFAKDYSPN